MRRVLVERFESDDLGTYSLVSTDSGFQCYGGELPWRADFVEVRGRSCVRPFVGILTWGDSPKHGQCYHFPSPLPGGRTDVEVHAANWMGDAMKGLACQLEGCLALGRAVMNVGFPDRPGFGQKGLSSSKDALDAFVADLARKPFELTLKWKDGFFPTEN